MALWHLWWQWPRQTQLHLDGVVDEPLECCKSSNHDNPRAKTTPESRKAEVLDARAESGALHLVHVGHQGVGGVGDDSTEDSCDVTGGEGDDQLLGLAALISWFRHHIGIKGLYGSLKTGKLHHGVWDLTTPQGNERLVESVKTLSPVQCGSSTPKSGGEGSQLGGLHLTLTASIGLRAMSAKNSADAEAAKYKEVLYKYVFSSPIMLE